MATRKSTKGTLSGWVDATVPDASVRAVLSRYRIDVDPFIRWLGPQLGSYRDEMRVRAQMPTRADERDALRELRRHIRDVHRGLLELGPRARVELCTRLGADLDIGRMAADLVLLEAGAHVAETEIIATKARPGAKGTTLRDDLLVAVVKQLRAAGIGVRKARELASDILALCDIDAPTGERELRKKARPRGP